MGDLHGGTIDVMRWLVPAAVVLAVVMVVLVLVIVLRPVRRTAAPITTVSEEELFGADAADLEEAFAEAEAAGLDARRKLLRVRLESLRSHRVPLRRITTSPGPGVARLGFADGTGVLARTQRTGDFANVVRLQHRGGLVLTGYADHPGGVVVVLETAFGRGRCELVVVGLDQSD